MYVSLCACKVFFFFSSRVKISLYQGLEEHTENTLVLCLLYYHVCNVVSLAQFIELKYSSVLL